MLLFAVEIINFFFWLVMVLAQLSQVVVLGIRAELNCNLFLWVFVLKFLLGTPNTELI
jgi:hypothetical protein